MPATVRRLSADEGDLIQALRIGAIDEAPHQASNTSDDVRAESRAMVRTRTRLEARSSSLARFVAEREGRVVGMIRAQRVGDAVNLDSLWVHPEQRRGGLASALIDAATDWGARLGATAVSLDVARDNDPALALYAKLGYTPTGRSHRQFVTLSRPVALAGAQLQL